MANETTLNMTLLLRRAEFTDSCLLKEGEPGFNTKTHEFKIGQKDSNGNLIQWKDLPLANGPQFKEWVEDVLRNYATTGDLETLRTSIHAFLGFDEVVGEGKEFETVKAYIDALEEALKGDADSTKDSASIEGAKRYADDAVHTHATATTAHTKAQVGLSEVENVSVETIKSRFTGAIEAKNDGFAKGGDVYTAVEGVKTIIGAYTDAGAVKNAIEAAQKTADEAAGAVSSLSTAIDNLTNIMNFRGVVDNFNKIANPKAGDVIAFSADLKDGDTVIAKAGSEWVYDGENWVEIGTASATDAALDALAGRVETIESDLNTATTGLKAQVASIKSDLDTAETGVKARLAAAEDEIDNLQAIVSTGADNHETRIGAIETAIATGGSVANAIEDAKQAGIDAQADIDALEKVVYAGTAGSGTTSAPADGTVMKDIDDLQTLTTGGTVAANVTKMVSGGVVHTAIEGAKAALVGTATDTVDDNTFVGIRKAIEAGDSAAVTSANEYTDAQLKAAAARVKAGTENADIVVTPDTTTGETTVAHKTYRTGTYTKPDAVNDANFVTGVTIENGHVTGASVKSLAEALAAMTFIFDGGTSADTIE